MQLLARQSALSKNKTITGLDLAAYKITASNGKTWITSVSATTTEAEARAYFLGKTFTDENPETGEETTYTAIAIERLS